MALPQGTGQQAPERLAARTIEIPDPGDLVDLLPEPAGVAWIRHGDGLAGWGETARITLPAGEDRFTAGEKGLRELFDGAESDDQVAEPGSGPVAFGSFTFDSASDGSVLVGLNGSSRALPAVFRWTAEGVVRVALGALSDSPPSTNAAVPGTSPRC